MKESVRGNGWLKQSLARHEHPQRNLEPPSIKLPPWCHSPPVGSLATEDGIRSTSSHPILLLHPRLNDLHPLWAEGADQSEGFFRLARQPRLELALIGQQYGHPLMVDGADQGIRLRGHEGLDLDIDVGAVLL